MAAIPRLHLELDLIESASQGDTEAIETLLLQYQPSLIRFARKYCATPEDVEDAVQETLWIVYQKINTLRSASAFLSWVFQIVRNHCYRLLHGKYQDDEALASVRLNDLDAAAVEIDPELYAALKHDVVTAIAHLPADYRQILIMRDLEGFTAPEVAQHLGLTLETVKSRLHRARNLLRESLATWA
jgi:RNA polymerase sigma factor (sigma-70 family)